MSATELAIIETGRKNHDNNEGGKNESNNENNSLTQAEKERLAINERRSRVASLLAQSRNESEIAEIVGVNQSTVSRDIQALKEDSRKYSEDLAKSVVIFWNQQSSRGVDEVKRRLWDIVNSNHGE